MSKMLTAAAAAVGLAMLAPGLAAAGPCEQLAGARWIYYSEGLFGSPGVSSLSVGTVDFRRGVVGAAALATLGQQPINVGASSAIYGQSTIQKITACSALPGNAALLSSNSGGSSNWQVSADGKSAVITGAHANDLKMKGWGTRVP